MGDSLEITVARLEEKFDGLETKVDDIHGTLKAFINSADDKYAPRKDVDELKDNQKWLVRLVVGAVILALLALIGLKAGL